MAHGFCSCFEQYLTLQQAFYHLFIVFKFLKEMEYRN